VMVVDEFGRTSGLITLEDLVEEILGESSTDENDDDHDDIVLLERLDDETFIVEAQMNLTELNEILGLNLPICDYQTLGGFLLYEWQKIPVQDETLIYQNLSFTIVTVQGPRLEKIRIHRPLSINAPTKLEETSALKSHPLVLNRYSHSR